MRLPQFLGCLDIQRFFSFWITKPACYLWHCIQRALWFLQQGRESKKVSM